MIGNREDGRELSLMESIAEFGQLGKVDKDGKFINFSCNRCNKIKPNKGAIPAQRWLLLWGLRQALFGLFR